jgi:membrane-associated HD superfamily phosphohydrolase
MRTEMANTTSALTSKAQKELAARMAAEAEAEALRLNMGGMKQHMAKTAAELERERQTAAAMKDRVNKLNANFIQTSDQLRSTTTELSSKLQREAAARAAAEVEAESSRLGLGNMSQQMAKTAAELEKERNVAQEMKSRVVALNKTYMENGEEGAGRSVHAVLCRGVAATMPCHATVDCDGVTSLHACCLPESACG